MIKIKEISNKGFGLLEILIIISIVTLIGIIIMPNLINFQKNQAMKNTTDNIVSFLNKAKSDSNSSLNSNNYGVHFESDSMIYFVGSNFLEGDENNELIDFDSGVKILDTGGINLNGGGNNVIFPRLTGDVIGYGTIIIQLISEPTIQKTITISKIGAISSN